MRSAAPIADQKVAAGYGHHTCLSLSHVDEVTTTIVRKEIMPSPGHQPGFLPAWLTEPDGCVLIAGATGWRARTLFAEGHTRMLVGALDGDPKKVFLDYVRGKLARGDNISGH